MFKFFFFNDKDLIIKNNIGDIYMFGVFIIKFWKL